MGVERVMIRRTVGRVCIGCARLFYPTRGSSTTLCTDCGRTRNQQRNRERPWYQTPAYRSAQRAAKALAGRACPRCRTPMVGKHRPSVDHITPVSRGGSWDGPFQVVCLACNISKGPGCDPGAGFR